MVLAIIAIVSFVVVSILYLTAKFSKCLRYLRVKD